MSQPSMSQPALVWEDEADAPDFLRKFVAQEAEAAPLAFIPAKQQVVDGRLTLHDGDTPSWAQAGRFAPYTQEVIIDAEAHPLGAQGVLVIGRHNPRRTLLQEPRVLGENLVAHPSGVWDQVDDAPEEVKQLLPNPTVVAFIPAGVVIEYGGATPAWAQAGKLARETVEIFFEGDDIVAGSE